MAKISQVPVNTHTALFSSGMSAGGEAGRRGFGQAWATDFTEGQYVLGSSKAVKVTEVREPKEMGPCRWPWS